VDVGANVGYFSRLASRFVKKSGYVFAFEVEPNNYYALNRNTASLPNVIPFNLAVSNDNSFLKINHSSHSACHSIVNNDHHLDGNHFITPTITLDKFWSLYLDHSEIDLIKIDVEGAEPFVLEGMEKMLSKSKVENMIIEYCPKLLENTGINKNRFFRMLSNHFSISVIENKFKNITCGEKLSDLNADYSPRNFVMSRKLSGLKMCMKRTVVR